MNIFVPIDVPTYPRSPPEKITREQLVELSERKPWKFNLALMIDIFLITMSIVISEYFWFNPFVFIISLMLIGSRLHGIAILMHETTHSLAYKNRMTNLFVGEILAWPILTTMSGYRTNHLLHHRKLNTDDDPDWVRNKNVYYVYPKSKLENIFYLILLLSGIVAIPALCLLNRNFSRYRYNKIIEVFRIFFYTSVITASIIFDFWLGLIIYWIIPVITVLFFLLSYRGMAEHHGNLEYSHIYNSTRHVKANWFEKFFLAQHNVEYHLAHHLYPQVPFYNLPKLHEILMQKPIYREKAHITEGYLKGLVKEITL